MGRESDADGAVRELDVREIEGEPFSDIMAALDSLPDDGTLRLINGFEPVPLYGVLERRGFAHETAKVADGEWRISIERA
ncbi:DUF2249 domain-containing protein (plasmid) [Haloferacaceae archaeon DSL9]